VTSENSPKHRPEHGNARWTVRARAHRPPGMFNRLPILVWAGAALLGWIAGDVIATDPAVHPKLGALFAGPLGAKLDSLLASIGASPHFANHGNGGEVLLAVLGVVVVLVAGAIWRKRALAVEQSANAA